jgi:hypothetical protein
MSKNTNSVDGGAMFKFDGISITKHDRRHFIGGSDARVIMGKDEKSLLRLWKEKRGEAAPVDLSTVLIVQLGLVTEDLNRRWYELNSGHRISDVVPMLSLEKTSNCRARGDPCYVSAALQEKVRKAYFSQSKLGLTSAPAGLAGEPELYVGNQGVAFEKSRKMAGASRHYFWPSPSARARPGGEFSFWPRVVDLNHRSDIRAGELQLGDDGRPEQPALFFGALDKLVKLIVEFADNIFNTFWLGHPWLPMEADTGARFPAVGNCPIGKSGQFGGRRA